MPFVELRVLCLAADNRVVVALRSLQVWPIVVEFLSRLASLPFEVAALVRPELVLDLFSKIMEEDVEGGGAA